MKKITMGILAHVDAGKTTLTESLLFNTGMIRSAGRVDNGDAFLDTEELEKKRGVTILSKQALIDMSKDYEGNKAHDDVRITIIDTPGHTDFIGETERALSVLDIAVLLVSGPDGVTATTGRLISMLETYRVPYLVFVNKMDMCHRTKEDITKELKEAGEGFVDFTSLIGSSVLDIPDTQNEEPIDLDMDIWEEIASLSEETIEKYLDTGVISKSDVQSLLSGGRLHPVLYGSALKGEGVNEFISILTGFLPDIKYREDFSAKVFKLGYEDGHKLSFVKVTGGSVSVRDMLNIRIAAEEEHGSAEISEKISQIRLYNGERYESIDKAEAGDVVTFVGLEGTYVGMGLGSEPDDKRALCQPVLRYNIILPIDMPHRVFIPKFRELVAENPLLYLEVSENETITISVMGEFQLEILEALILDRCNVKVTFVPAGIILKETIASPVIGFGHFEPLRHYAEVQIMMEPLPRGSGIEIGSALSVNELGINWQKTILATISNDLPKGVLTGSALTDIRFTLVAGRAHLKHTDSQDFREAVRRAIRQGLMKTENVLLEPYFSFTLNLPADNVGRALNDISEMGGSCTVQGSKEKNGEVITTLTGDAPARLISNYQVKLTGYTSGRGVLDMKLSGFKDCPEDIQSELIEEKGYEPDTDKNNVSGSIFIEHGAGYYVPWFECEAKMHLPSREAEFLYTEEMSEDEKLLIEAGKVKAAAKQREAHMAFEERFEAIGTDEIDVILRSSTHANSKNKKERIPGYFGPEFSYDNYSGVADSSEVSEGTGTNENNKYLKRRVKEKMKEKFLLVDGYNIIHAWNSLKGLLSDVSAPADRQSLDLEAARVKLLEIMSEYMVLKDIEIIVVFDAYNVKGHMTEKMDYLGVHVVYTKQAETADQYIAKFTLQNAKNFDITVATSDSMIQLIILSENAKKMSAADLEADVIQSRKKALESIKQE